MVNRKASFFCIFFSTIAVFSVNYLAMFHKAFTLPRGTTMIVNGIITEYNPFHNGHKLHTSESRSMTGADYTIAVMSGSFVQRGEPAIISKYRRTESALRCGVDLVLQLPEITSISSAEYFAMGGVALLDHLGVCDHLCFGSEFGSVPELQRIAEIMVEEPAEYAEAFQKNLKQGMTWPMARNSALMSYAPELYNVTEILNFPNNVLAIEYLKAIIRLGSRLHPVTMRRQASQYHSLYPNSAQHASSLAIRQAVLFGENKDGLKNLMPEVSYRLMMESAEAGSLMRSNDFSEMMLYKLMSEADQGYTKYLDVSQELSDRIRNHLQEFTSFEQFCDLIKTKNMTYVRISRSLFHILLGITDADVEKQKMVGFAPYARVLGFRKEAEPHLREIKTHASIPIITSMSEAREKLYAEPLDLLQKGSQIENIYLAARAVKSGVASKGDFSHPIVVI